LTWDRQLGLELNLPRVQAQQRIADGKIDSRDWDAVYDIVLEAYGDKELAERERLEAMKRVVREETEEARKK